MRHCTTIPTAATLPGRVDQLPGSDRPATPRASAAQLSPTLESGYRAALWQLGLPLATIDTVIGELRGSGLDEQQLQEGLQGLAFEAQLQSTDGWRGASDIVQQQPPNPGQPIPLPPARPGKLPPAQQPPAEPPQTGPAPLPLPLPPGPPGVPAPPKQGPPGVPAPPTEPPAGPPAKPPAEPGDGPSLAPWLVGAGILAAGVGGAVALRTGSRNVHALRATAAAYESGAMHQGGLQAIRDAGLGARFASGIRMADAVAVATPGINRIGSTGRLTAVARGHLDHAELLASSTALRRGTGAAVYVDEPLRASVLDGLVRGRSMPSILDDLDRTAGKQTVAFDNGQLRRYWNQASIVERGPRSTGVTSGSSVHRPQLRIAEPVGTRFGEIVETGRTTRINRLEAGRGADLGGDGLATGIGTVQGSNVSSLPPALQARAIEAAGVDPKLVESIGLNGAFTQRWRDRLAAGAAAPPPRPAPQ